MKFVHIPGGTFKMGDEWLLTTVDDFEIMSTPITQKMWEEVMGNNRSHFKGPENPVETVSWFGAVKFAEKLGPEYRLPTEAEQEYLLKWAKDQATGPLKKYAWYDVNSKDQTHLVGQLQPLIVSDPCASVNSCSIYDLFGNVWEWSADWYGPLKGGDNPKGPEIGLDRVVRGGCWASNASYCRVAFRNHYDPGSIYGGVGFRLARRI